jgi:hypothetical protein
MSDSPKSGIADEITPQMIEAVTYRLRPMLGEHLEASAYSADYISQEVLSSALSAANFHKPRAGG